jgi:hypothetical protein
MDRVCWLIKDLEGGEGEDHFRGGFGQGEGGPCGCEQALYLRVCRGENEIPAIGKYAWRELSAGRERGGI